MNRYMVSGVVTMALLLAPAVAVDAQTGAHIEYRNGRIGIGVVLGSAPVHVGPYGTLARGWMAADWGPIRIRVATRRPSLVGNALSRKELRHIVGKAYLREIERHARYLGVHGRTEGWWLQAHRYTTVLEVTVGRVPVAALYDYGNDGLIDRIFLADGVHAVRHGEVWMGPGAMGYNDGPAYRGGPPGQGRGRKPSGKIRPRPKEFPR
jgi:hypothetical protein